MSSDVKPATRAAKRNRSARGALTCVAMFALGGAVLWGLFHARRAASPRSPDVPWGAPARTVRFASFDCRGGGFAALADAVDAIRKLDPDFVMIQQVPAADVLVFVERLGMEKSFYTQLFQRTGPGSSAETGCVVLSKHVLYDAGGIRPAGRRGPCLGTWAVAVVDGVRFAVVSAQVDGAGDVESLRRAWADRGTPPVVIGASPAVSVRDRLRAVAGAGSVIADVRWVTRNAAAPATTTTSTAGLAWADLSKSADGASSEPGRVEQAGHE